MKLSDCISKRANGLVLQMYEHNLGYDPYESRQGYRVFHSMDHTSGFPMTFESWKAVREWLNGVYD